MVRKWMAVSAALLAVPAAAESLSGRATVVDGDTLKLSGEVIRLHGIDAPESGQRCARSNGGTWDCGKWARKQLTQLVGSGPVTCAGQERDRYGRLVAKCMRDGVDIGEAMVERGAAHAYRKYSLDYVDAEKRAFVAALGLWQGDHLPPEAYRARQGRTAEVRPASGCAIKGNISKSGRIYHMPGQRDYAATRINEAKGERWFCSEAEARAAGWRAARR